MILVIKNGICKTDIINILKYIVHSVKFNIIQSDKLTDKLCYDIMAIYNAIIILGGHHTLTNIHSIEYSHKYLNNLINFTKIWIDNNKHILGEALECKTKSI